MTGAPPIHRTERGGIPIVWSPHAEGNYTLGMIFRAGRADERLDILGVSHLVEHLICPAKAADLERLEGTVDATLTTLSYTADNPEDCLTFARGIADRIRQLPYERFEIEKKILRAEGDIAQRPTNYALARRFGARQLGLMGFPQVGLRWLEFNEVQGWALRHLNSANVVIWMDWEPSDDLEIDLPPGERLPTPELEPIEYLCFPAFATGPNDFLLLQFLRARSAASTVALDLLQQHLITSLRLERGLGYQVGWSEETQTGPIAISTLWSDPRTIDAPLAIETALHGLEEMVSEGSTANEIAETIARREGSLAGPEMASARLTRHAIAELDPARELDERSWESEIRALEPEQVAESVRLMSPTTLILAPSNVEPPRGFVRLPDSAPERASGKRFAFKHLPAHARKRKLGAFLSPPLLSIVTPDNPPITIDLSEAALLVHLDKGSRAIWGADGSYQEVAKEWFKGGDKLIAAIDEAVPDERRRIDLEHVAKRAAIDRALAWYPSRDSLILWLVITVLALILGAPLHTVGFALLPFILLVVTVLIHWRKPSRSSLAEVVGESTGTDEEVVSVVQAQLGGKISGSPGLLIATSRRLLFVSSRKKPVEIELSDITSIKRRPLFAAIVVYTTTRKLRFEYITPYRGCRAFVRSLQNRPRLTADPPRWSAEHPSVPLEENASIDSKSAR